MDLVSPKLGWGNTKRINMVTEELTIIMFQEVKNQPLHWLFTWGINNFDLKSRKILLIGKSFFFLGRMSTTLMHSYERNGLGIYLRLEGVAKGEVI